MAANRYSLVVIGSAGTEGPAADGRVPFSIAPTGNGGRSYVVKSRPYQPGDPRSEWRIPLHPFDGGLNIDRLGTSPRTYAKANGDASNFGLFVPPPLLNTLTLTNATLPFKSVRFGTDQYILGGRYMYKVDSSYTVTEDKDFGVGKACVDACVFKGELIVAMGETEKIHKRTAGGSWSQASDNTFAIALGAFQDKLYRAESTNVVTVCTTTPLTLANWGPSPGYPVKNSGFAVRWLTEWGGTVWARKGDGIYQADAQGRFINQAPQLERSPDTEIPEPAVAQGNLWVPSKMGLFRISPGSSKPKGPEVTGAPGRRWFVRGVAEGSNCIWLLADDEQASSETCILKMVKDVENLAGRGADTYRYYEHVRLGATTKGYFLNYWGDPTNPSVVSGFGNNAVYFKLGRGGGRDIDDSNYRFGTAALLETGPVAPQNDLSIVSNLGGTELVCRADNANEQLDVDYAVEDGAYADLLNEQESGGGTSAITTSGWQSVIRYAPTRTEGQFFQFRLIGALVTTSTYWQVREWWAFGWSHPKFTDEIQIAVIADAAARNGMGHAETFRMWRNWQGQELAMQLPDYETGRTTRFLVASVEEAEVKAELGAGAQPQLASFVKVSLVRVDRAQAYAT